MAKTRNSKAKLVMELTGPTGNIMDAVVSIMGTAGKAPGVTVTYPAPVLIESVVRERKARTVKVANG